ncbi:MAG: DUF4258 domain-containing protein [Ignavibacteriae bacterium]|nr:DUF4258 domain-containing protein [Ignavibacteriota bacterium]
MNPFARQSGEGISNGGNPPQGGLQRLAERGVKQKVVIDVLLSGEVIEEYPEDKPFPSALFLGFPGGDPLHVVAAFDETQNLVYIITAYDPSGEYFLNDYRTRRKQ